MSEFEWILRERSGLSEYLETGLAVDVAAQRQNEDAVRLGDDGVKVGVGRHRRLGDVEVGGELAAAALQIGAEETAKARAELHQAQTAVQHQVPRKGAAERRRSDETGTKLAAARFGPRKRAATGRGSRRRRRRRRRRCCCWARDAAGVGRKRETKVVRLRTPPDIVGLGLEQRHVDDDGGAEEARGDALEDAGPQVAARRRRRQQVQRQLVALRDAREGHAVRVGRLGAAAAAGHGRLLVDAAQTLQEADQIAAQRLQHAAVLVQQHRQQTLADAFEEAAPPALYTPIRTGSSIDATIYTTTVVSLLLAR